MRVIAVNCNQCGAPLQVPAKTRFLTCGFCSSRLEVHREGDAIYSEVLESIEEKTNQIAEDVETIRVQNELERLDREWLSDQAQLMVRGKHGEFSVPTIPGAMIGIAVAVVFGLVWIGIAINIGAPMSFPLFGLVFIAFGVFLGVSGMQKAKAMQSRRQRFEFDRSQVLNQPPSRVAGNLPWIP